MNTHFKACCAISIAIALSACNSTTSESITSVVDIQAPSLTTTPVDNIVLLSNENVTLGFTESVDITSFKLLVDTVEFESVSLTWNETKTEVTLAPTSHWPSGDNSIVVKVADDAGNEFQSDPFNVVVNLTLDIDQQAALVFGEVEEADRAYYGNAFMDERGIWLSDYGDGALYFYSGFPAERNAEPEQIITSIEYIDPETLLTESRDFDGTQTPFVYQEKLFVAEYSDNAVYIFDEVPTEGEENFGIVLGYPDFELTSEADSCSVARLSSPEAVMAVDDRLIVVDGSNSRVLIWNTIPEESGVLPDLVLGQFDFDTCDSGSNEFLMANPSGVWSDGTKLLVVDGDNSRVMGWNTFPTTNGQAADFVLGQNDFFENDCNLGNDQPSANSLCSSYEGVFSNGRQIFVADSDNNRVLVWNDWPTANGVDADIVLGKRDFIGTDDDETEESEEADNRFSYVTGVFVYDNHLLVSDESNGAIVVFDGQ